MIEFKRYSLDNGLRIIVHEDDSTPLVAMNLLYDVGSKDEDPEMTGLAHLAEHLMFSGSVNIPDFDKPLQTAGGENNAFTNNDITNYFLTLPAENIETGFWLESDRMLGPDFSPGNLEAQINVVTEEFNQRYLNQPYGDAILKLRPLAYEVHPYRWPAIGMDISHIRKADTDDVRRFFNTHYAPNNAILAVAGNTDPSHVIDLANKWFGPLPRREIAVRNFPQEPVTKSEKRVTLERDLPADALYKVWHTCGRTHDDFYTLDLITDLLAGGESGWLNTKLVREKKMFSEINAYITSDIDPGLLILHGRLMNGTDLRQAEESVHEVLGELHDRDDMESEMEKVRNRFESATVLANTSILNKAANLAFYELLGDAGLVNHEVENYFRVTPDKVRETSKRYFTASNCSTLCYLASKKVE